MAYVYGTSGKDIGMDGIKYATWVGRIHDHRGIPSPATTGSRLTRHWSRKLTLFVQVSWTAASNPA